MVDAARLEAIGLEVMSDVDGGSLRVGGIGLEVMSDVDLAGGLRIEGIGVETMSKSTTVGGLRIEGFAVEVMSNQIPQASAGGGTSSAMTDGIGLPFLGISMFDATGIAAVLAAWGIAGGGSWLIASGGDWLI